jgi:hypothetical protein
MRIEDGLGSVVRTDPESYPGEREVFIYYNIKTPSGVFEIHRAATGIVSTRAASLRVHAVRPSTTDPAIDGNDETHYAMLDRDVPPLNRLLLFFPGTGARPYDYLKFSRTAAQLGYHAIALSYENAQSINFNLCPRTVDTTCHHRARYEIWFGEDRHAGIDVNRANSIVHRLFALLQHLSTTHPDEGWDQYFALGGGIRWERIVTAGHSQGGGHAGFGSKYFGVSRVIMFAATDWVSTGRTADWITMPGPTPPERYFGLVHEEDVPIFSTIPITWRDYGMLRFGPIVGIETMSPPYNHSHALTTARPVSDGLRAHNLPIVDFATPSDENGNELYAPVWEYLLRDAATNSMKTPPIVSEFSVYPNPAAGMLVIQTTSPSDMRITDLMGREIWNGRVEMLRTVNLSGWTPGMYFIHGGTDVRRILVR